MGSRLATELNDLGGVDTLGDSTSFFDIPLLCRARHYRCFFPGHASRLETAMCRLSLCIFLFIIFMKFAISFSVCLEMFVNVWPPKRMSRLCSYIRWDDDTSTERARRGWFVWTILQLTKNILICRVVNFHEELLQIVLVLAQDVISLQMFESHEWFTWMAVQK